MGCPIFLLLFYQLTEYAMTKELFQINASQAFKQNNRRLSFLHGFFQ